MLSRLVGSLLRPVLETLSLLKIIIMSSAAGLVKLAAVLLTYLHDVGLGFCCLDLHEN